MALARDADVLIHEATYTQADAALARRSWHSTALSAARVAQEAHAGLLILTHFSTRYESSVSQMNELLEEARSLFPNTLLAHDFWSYEIPRRGPA